MLIMNVRTPLPRLRRPAAEAKLSMEPADEGSWFSGCAFLSDIRLVLADKNRKSINLYETHGNRVASHTFNNIKADGPTNMTEPWDVTKVNDRTLALTLGGPKIDLFTVSGDNFLHKSSVVLSEMCLSLNCRQDYFAVRCVDHSVRIISADSGRETKRIFYEGMRNPKYVTLDDSARHVFVTDWVNHTVFCFTIDGYKCWEFSHPKLREPKGITFHENSVFVAGWESDTIIQISNSGRFVGTVLGPDHIAGPRTICINPSGDKMVVTQMLRDPAMIFTLDQR